MTRDQGSWQEQSSARPGPNTSAPFVYEKNTSTYSVFSRHPDLLGERGQSPRAVHRAGLETSNQVTDEIAFAIPEWS